jgi:hypothetical protein
MSARIATPWLARFVEVVDPVTEQGLGSVA